MIYPKKPSKKKRKKHKESILQDKDGRCYICMKNGSDRIWPVLHKHHAFLGANRPIAEAEGLYVFLCPDHHEFGKDAVHKNYEILREIQKDAQRAFEENHSRQQFMELMGRNYCIEESDGAEDSEEKKEEWGEQTMNGMITWI